MCRGYEIHDFDADATEQERGADAGDNDEPGLAIEWLLHGDLLLVVKLPFHYFCLAVLTICQWFATLDLPPPHEDGKDTRRGRNLVEDV